MCFSQFAAACARTNDSCTATKLLNYSQQAGLELKLGPLLSLFMVFASNSNVEGMTQIWQLTVSHHLGDKVAYTRLLKACGNVGAPALSLGKTIHAHMLSTRLVWDQVLTTTLVQMYISCKAPECALQCWPKAIQTLASLDDISYSVFLDACAAVGPSALSTGKDIHQHIRESHSTVSANIGIPLVRMYLLCQADIWLAQTEWSSLASQASLSIKPEGYVRLLTACSARNSEGLVLGKSVFSHLLSQPDWNLNLILFSAVINMLVRCGDSSFASSIFTQKLPRHAQDLAIYQSTFAACDATGDWQFAQHVHSEFMRSGLQTNVRIYMSLITMYTRCLHLEKALKLWQELANMEPDTISLVMILTACSDVGDHLLGIRVHTFIIDNNIKVMSFLFLLIIVVTDN